MLEFAVALAALALLALGTVMISNYQELQRRGIIAARQSAFLGAWLAGRPGSRSLSEQTRADFFDDRSLVDAVGRPLLTDREALSVTNATGRAPGRGAGAFTALMAPLRVASGFLGGEFDLRDDGYLTGVVGIRSAGRDGLPPPFDSLELRFEQSYALLTNAWSAAGPSQVGRRSSGLVPAHALSSLTTTWRALSAPLSLVEPSLRQLCPGIVEPERVPDDRLSPGGISLSPSC